MNRFGIRVIGFHVLVDECETPIVQGVGNPTAVGTVVEITVATAQEHAIRPGMRILFDVSEAFTVRHHEGGFVVPISAILAIVLDAAKRKRKGK